MPTRARRSVRLPTWDYAAAAWYSVTVCTHGRAPTLGTVTEGTVTLTPLGEIVERSLRATPDHHARVILDASVVMPNHVHVILGLTGDHARGAGRGRAGSGSLGAVVGAFKAAVTRAARAQGLAEGVWQRGFYEHVVRGEATLDRHRRYIEENPARWKADRYFAL